MSAPLASDRDRDTLKSFARRVDPSDAGAHNNLGVLYYNKGLYQEAAAAGYKNLESMRMIEYVEKLAGGVVVKGRDAG